MKIIGIISVFVLAKIFFLTISIVLDNIFEDYDMSSELQFDSENKPFLYPMFNFMIRWDSHFFLEIAKNGYSYEKNHAFFPFFPYILTFFSKPINFVLKDQTISVAFTCLIINFLLHLVSLIILYKTSCELSKNRIFSACTCFLYIFNPSSIFYCVIYCEALFSCLIVSAIYYYHKTYMQIKNKNLNHLSFIIPSVFLVLSISVRSNGLFFLAIPGYLCLIRLIDINLKKFSFLNTFKICFTGIFILTACISMYFVIVSWYPSSIYCTNENKNQILWCKDKIPNVYGFIQKAHWKVGLFCSYELKRIFFIIWGFATLAIVFSSINYTLKNNFKFVVSLGFSHEIKNSEEDEDEDEDDIFKNQFIIPFIIYTFVLFLISALFAHIQSSTRFFSSNPYFYWYSAKILCSTGNVTKKHLILLYYVVFNIFGIVLFSNYLPWT